MMSIDNEKPTKEQRETILNSTCIQCKEPYDEGRPIMFVVTSSGLIWWHIKNDPAETAPCKYKMTERPHIKKITNRELIKKYDALLTHKSKGKVL